MFRLGSAQKPRLRPGFGRLGLVKIKAQAAAQGLGRPRLGIGLGRGLHSKMLLSLYIAYYCMYYKKVVYKNIFGARDAYASRAPSLVVVVVAVAVGGGHTSSWLLDSF